MRDARAREAAVVLRWMARGGARSAVEAAVKAPFVARAGVLLEGVRLVTLQEAMSEFGIDSVALKPAVGGTHAWQIGVVEQSLLAAVAARRAAARVFEIGTFDGGTTLAVSQALPHSSEVHTIDLPDHAFDATQSPDAFTGADVGRQFRGVDPIGRAQIIQHRADTRQFDFSPWRASIDVVLVDAAHDYQAGLKDSHTALQLVRPGGLVFWDDLEPYWHGLVRGVIETVGARNLTKIARTSLAYFQAPA